MAGNAVNAPGPGDPRYGPGDPPPGPDPDPANHPLIVAQLARLADQLPPDVVDELADGLRETWHRHLAETGDAEDAARAAIGEFGDADTLVRAFEVRSPGRRTAIALLVTGPVVGTCWADALITQRAWTWPVPLAVAVAVGAALAVVVAVSVRLVFGHVAYRRVNRTAAATAVLVMLVDAAMLTAAITSTPAVTVPVAVAGCASVIRLVLTGHRLPVLARS